MVQRSVKRSAVRVRWELEEYTLDTPAQEQTVSDSTQIPNPWESYDTADAAANAAGFTLTAPEAISGSSAKTYQVMNSGDGEVIFEMCLSA